MGSNCRVRFKLFGPDFTTIRVRFLIGSGKLIGSDFSVKSDSIVFQEERKRGGGGNGHSKAPISLEEGVGREQGGKRYIFNEIKGGTERTGVQRFVSRYVEINAVNFFYWMPFSNIKMVHLMPHFPF